MKIAVQLYSLRHHINNGDDLLDILGKVKELGFDGVEFAGYFGLDADTLKARLDELGLVAVGTHCGLENYDEEHLEDTLAFGKTLGMKTMGMGGADLSDREKINNFCRIMKRACPIAEKEGIKLYFHNHSGEFKAVDGGEKMLIEEITDACYIQVDTYWSFYAGIDNYRFLTENKDKIVHIHIKDGIDGHPMALTEGSCDLDTVVKAAKDIGLEWVILENDDPVPDGLSDVARSMKFLEANFR